MAIRLCVEQAADTVEVEHQRVLLFHLLPRHCLGPGKAVADQLEHQRIAGQGEHRHDHARRAFGRHQPFLRMLVEVAEEGAVALGLALLGAAQHGVDLIDRLARQQAAQEHHRIPHRGKVGLEVAARHAEQVGDIAAPGQHGIGAQPALIVDQGDHARREAMLAEHAADQIGAALAIEHGVEQLDAAYRRVTPMGQISASTRCSASTGRVGETA
ncbi:hypothetical protein G6F35_014894 [Rhizopus arrhizus]|nr:hypothetical protein G6F35_014894 [Rhizopus arrhizus]